MKINNITSFKGNFYMMPRKEVHMENREFVFKKSDEVDIFHFSNEKTRDHQTNSNNRAIKEKFGIIDSKGKLIIEKDIKGALYADVKDEVIVAPGVKVDHLHVTRAEIEGNEKGANHFLITKNVARKD